MDAGKAAEAYLKEQWKNVENLIMPVVDKVLDAISPPTQVQPTDSEKANTPPEAVDEKQQTQIPPTNGPLNLNGALNPLYNPNGVVEGQKGGDKVMTQEGSQQQVVKPDDPTKVKVDTINLGKNHILHNMRHDNTRDVGKRVVVGGDTLYVYQYTEDLTTGKRFKRADGGAKPGP